MPLHIDARAIRYVVEDIARLIAPMIAALLVVAASILLHRSR